MAIDVDALFANLSNMAKSNGTTLNELAKSANVSKHTYLKLADCCLFVRDEMPRFTNGDPFNYLATLDEYAKRPDRTHSELWESLQKGPHSKFLDTLVEAMWAIHFTRKGIAVSLKVPINPSSKDSKDVDFFIMLNDKEWWLDAISVGPNQLRANSVACNGYQCLGLPSIESAVSRIAKKAEKKYRKKFSKDVKSGFIADSSAGILLCLMKEHSPLDVAFCASHGRIAVEPPPNFFNNKPGLGLVLIHTIRVQDEQDVLEPFSLYRWWNERIDKSSLEDNFF